MPGTERILERIREEQEGYSSNYRQIAGIILDRPEEVTRMSIGHLAQLAGVSDPSIIRFCRGLGHSGFKEFKFALAEEMAAGKTSYLHVGLKNNGNENSYIYKVASGSIATLGDMASSLDEAAIEAAVEVLSKADHVEFWGQGASAVVAEDAHHKFFRIGIPCVAFSDPHMQAMSASVMKASDALVCISHTGHTQELIYGADIARKRGAYVVGITPANSPLAGLCTHLISVRLNEDTDVVLPMVSRLAQMLIVDILTVGILQRFGKNASDRIRQTKEALSAIKYTDTFPPSKQNH